MVFPTCLGPPTLSVGWTFLTYSSNFRPWTKMSLNAGWIAVLVLPFGFWARRGWVGAIGSLLIASGLVFTPMVTELGPSGIVEYLGALVGFAAGQVIQRLLRLQVLERVA